MPTTAPRLPLLAPAALTRSTATMVQLGRVEGSLMTHISPVSRKLRNRSLRILMYLSQLPQNEAQALLDCHDGNLESALSEVRGPGRT